VKQSLSPPTTPTEPVIQWRIPELFADLAPETLLKLKGFHDELIKFNKTINLISANTIMDADIIHFADCILSIQAILKSGDYPNVHDIGSGNGFPGLIWAILAPKSQITMIDRDSRKVEFVKHVTSQLKLSNARADIMKVEDLPDNSVSCAISRGFATISKSILAVRKSVKLGGSYFHMKGERWGGEVADIPSQLCSIWEPALFYEYDLPSISKKQHMVLVVTKKIA
jgi:16S rRNA (guanine527-N7)-methyltransferase